MSRRLASCIVDLLRKPAPSEQTLAQMRGFSRWDWERTLFWLSSSGLPHYLVIRLRQLKCENLLPSEILENLNRNFAANQHRVQAMAQEFDSLNRRLSDASITFAAVRGFDAAPDYCAELSLRTWYCHEYLLARESLPRSRVVVESAGFPFRRTGPRGELCFASTDMQPPKRVDKVYTADFPRMVVLHHQTWDSNHSNVDVRPSNDVVEPRTMLSGAGMSFPTLTEDGLLEFVVLDTFTRVLGYWCKLSWFFEIANFLQSKVADDDFWLRFYRRIQGRGRLPDVAGVVFLMASHLFDGELPSTVRSHLAQLPAALRIWVESYGRDWALAKFPGSKLSLFLERELVRDASTWEQVLRSRLFPIPRTGSRVQAGNPSGVRTERNNWTRIFRRMKFHGTTTYEYTRELSRWNHLRQAEP